MKTIEELKTFYETELLSDLRQLEGRRKQAMQSSMIAFAAILIVGLIAGMIILANGGPAPLLIIPVVLAVIVGCGVFGLMSSGYKSEFKNRVIAPLIRFIAPGLEYRPEQCISKDIFKGSGIFTQRIDRYRGEDCVLGKVDQTQIMFSEVHAEYKTTSGTGKNRRTEWHTIFKGLFFIADFNKHFNGQTLVLPDTAQKLFGRFGQTLQSWAVGRGELIKMEDPLFEHEFVVYGTDQIEARYILSPSLMQRITEFKIKTGDRLYLSFTGSKVYVAVPIARNMFEPAYLSCADDFKCISEYYADLSMAIGIVDELNLNTRIWSKT
jgi:hypothetical protein